MCLPFFIVKPNYKSNMKVKLINYTPNPIETAFIAARTCYSGDGPEKLWELSLAEDENKIPDEKMHSLLDNVIASGHHSVLEHINFTFAIEEISRACSHQLVRHRIANFSQQSQRYVAVKRDAFVVPDTIKSNPDAKIIFDELIDNAKKTYDKLVDIGIPKEDARFVIPNAAKTNIVMTMNFREIYNVCQIRLCTRAQWEIRELFWKVKAELSKIDELKGLADYLQPKCVILGYCPENRSCGMYPTREEVLGNDS